MSRLDWICMAALLLLFVRQPRKRPSRMVWFPPQQSPSVHADGDTPPEDAA